jgi:hypothetical protein
MSSCELAELRELITEYWFNRMAQKGRLLLGEAVSSIGLRSRPDIVPLATEGLRFHRGNSKADERPMRRFPFEEQVR